MSNYQIAVPQHLKANRPKFIINISSWVLKLQKWKINGAIPEEKRVVLVIGPHTSNWDFIIGVLVILSLDAKINWLGKHTIFKRGFKGLLTRLGGIPVNRQDPSDLFSKIKVITEKSNGYLIGMAPEGTRKKVLKLKSGFIRIAKQTNSKIMLAGIDFQKKIVNLDKFFTPTGDLNNDLLFVQDYFSRYSGKRQQ
jgi:1-acyl-sn-glycerol-3-phosphate acyltransferase|tara:strand:+ start:73 stop:657 length:585 start_codon:yes stop_codon:yes gene_type:complete